MRKYVYLVPQIASPIAAPLRERGFEVVIGDGTYSKELLANCWAIVPARPPLTAEIIADAPNLKLVCKKGVGVDRIDIDACTERGICVANTPFSNYISVAEHTITLLLACAKRLNQMIQYVKCEDPDWNRINKLHPTEIYGKTLSVIGLGHIGMHTAKLAMGLGMKVLAYVRHPEKLELPEGIELASSMDDALSRGDFVSLHVSGSAGNRNLIGARELALMKPSAILINTTRGFVVDEEALYTALTTGQIAGAGLDVFVKEPIDISNPFLSLDNVVATPHRGGYTDEASSRGYMECADIIADFAAGKHPETAVNQVPITNWRLNDE